jgi:nucleotide-binding universal stress UspA family protein
MIGSILVPLDGSTFAECALPTALGIARRAGAKLELVTINIRIPATVSAHIPGYDAAWESAVHDRAEKYLNDTAKRVRQVADVTVQTTVRSGDIAEILLDQAAQVGADLIVMSTHGRGPLQRTWLGSVAVDVIRAAPLPVLLIRPDEGETPDFTKERVFEHVLVPLDGSGHGEEVLPWAVTLGALSNADYTLLQVVEPVWVHAQPYGTFPPAHLDAAQLRAQESAVEAYLDVVAGRLRKRDSSVATIVRSDPSPAAAILSCANEHGIDLIAMATHGRGGLGRILLGSVADKVVRGGETPVLLYRPRGTGANT